MLHCKVTLALQHDELVGEKHSSLFRPSVSDEEKKFYNVDTCPMKEVKLLIKYNNSFKLLDNVY